MQKYLQRKGWWIAINIQNTLKELLHSRLVFALQIISSTKWSIMFLFPISWLSVVEIVLTVQSTAYISMYHARERGGGGGGGAGDGGDGGIA